jgi:hypothetical protein
VAGFWTWHGQLAVYSEVLPPVDTVALQIDTTLELDTFQPTGSRRGKRLPSKGELSTQPQRQRQRPARTLAGDVVGAAAAQEQRAPELNVVHVTGPHYLVCGTMQHAVDRETRTCACAAFKAGMVCAHIIAAEQAAPNKMGSITGIVPTASLAHQ